MENKFAVAVYDPIAEEWRTYAIESTEYDANRVAANVQCVSGYPARIEPCASQATKYPARGQERA